MSNNETISLPVVAIAPESVLYVSEKEIEEKTVTQIRISNGQLIQIAPEVDGFAEMFAKKKFRNKNGNFASVKLGRYFINPRNVVAIETSEDSDKAHIHFPRFVLRAKYLKDSTDDRKAIAELVKHLGNGTVSVQEDGEVTGI